MPPAIRITDVTLRDGLQNEPRLVSTTDKADLARTLLAVGFDEIELTSFVSARWIPQLGDATDLCAMIAPDVAALGTPPLLSALVPNEKGMQALLATNETARREHNLTNLLSKASVFTAASETFAQKNTNASIAQTLERFVPVIALAREAGLQVRAYVSCVIACPFEGPIAPAQVADVCKRLADLGVDEIDLGDTIGAGTPETVTAAVRAAQGVTDLPITLHLHDTFGRAVECIFAALDLAIASFDASAAGLGGCPYASTPDKRAPGNVATSLLAGALEARGCTLSIDRAALDAAESHARRTVTRARAAQEPAP